jgi:hypothetical protein
MLGDIRRGKLNVELRRTDDVEALLASPRYRLGRELLGALDYADRARRWSGRQMVRASHAPSKAGALARSLQRGAHSTSASDTDASAREDKT